MKLLHRLTGMKLPPGKREHQAINDNGQGNNSQPEVAEQIVRQHDQHVGHRLQGNQVPYVTYSQLNPPHLLVKGRLHSLTPVSAFRAYRVSSS